MVRYADECNHCATVMFPCIGKGCPKLMIPHFICDECGNDVGEGILRHVEGKELCVMCILQKFPKVTEYSSTRKEEG